MEVCISIPIGPNKNDAGVFNTWSDLKLVESARDVFDYSSSLSAGQGHWGLTNSSVYILETEPIR